MVADVTGVLLKTTQKSRDLAKNSNFLEIIIHRLNKIFEGMDMQCTDFIRKYGDNKVMTFFYYYFKNLQCIFQKSYWNFFYLFFNI